MLISNFQVTSGFDSICIVVACWVNFGKSNKSRASIILLQCMKRTLQSIQLLRLSKLVKSPTMAVLFYFSANIVNILYHKYVHLGGNTCTDCSRISEVDVHARTADSTKRVIKFRY